MTGRRTAKVKPDWPGDDWSWDRTLEMMAEGAKAAPAKPTLAPKPTTRRRGK